MVRAISAIGFIGVGAMGKAMVVNIAKKTPEGTHIYINDIIKGPQDELCVAFPGKISSLSTAKEVAAKAVGRPSLH